MINPENKIKVEVKNKEDFDLLFNFVPQSVLLIDFETHEIINGNNSFSKTFGYDAKNIIGLTPLKSGIWDMSVNKILKEKLFDSEDLSGAEIMMYDIDGKEFYVLAQVEILFVEGRKVIIIIMVNINNQKKAEKELLANESRFKALFYNNAAPMAIYNLDSTIVDCNDAYCRVSGFSKSEIIGKSWFKQIPKGELERLTDLNKLWMQTAMDKHTELDIVFLNKQKERTYVHMSNSYIPEYKNVVRSFVDTTQKTKDDIKLAKHSEELKKLIEEKNKEITLNLLQIANSNTLIKQQQVELIKIKNQIEPKSIKLIEDINALIENNNYKTIPLNWERLREQIRLTRPTFLSSLLLIHPNLTMAEQKLSTLLSLQLSTKEIASITNQNYDSVRVSRTRLRKKLGLVRNVNIVAYLVAL